MWVPEAQLTWTSPQSPLLTLNAQVAESDDPVAVAERARTSARVLAGRPQPAAGPDPLAELVQELPSAREWRALVLDARKAIEAGPLTKVVLSRQLLLRTHGPQVAGHALRHLLASQDTGAVFGVRLAQRWFLGATPSAWSGSGPVRSARTVSPDRLPGTPTRSTTNGTPTGCGRIRRSTGSTPSSPRTWNESCATSAPTCRPAAETRC